MSFSYHNYPKDVLDVIDQEIARNNFGNRLDQSILPFNDLYQRHIAGAINAISTMRQENNGRTIPDIYIVVVRLDGYFGAKTFLKDGLYFIAVAHFTFHRIEDYFDKVFSGDSFPEFKLGTAARFVYLESREEGMTRFEEKYSLSHEWGKSDVPTDMGKLFAARSMTDDAVSYLLLHEIAHIINGHVGLVDEFNKSNRVMDALSRQTLEFDADSFATNTMVKLHLRMEKRVVELEANMVKRPYDKFLRRLYGLGAGLHYLMYTTCTLTMLSNSNVSIDDITKNDLSPEIRLTYVHSNIFSILIVRDLKELLEIFSKGYPMYLDFAERHYKTLTNHDKRPVARTKEDLERFHIYSRKIRDRWKQMYVELQPHAFAKLTKPEE